MPDPSDLRGLLRGLYDPDRAEDLFSELLGDLELYCSEIAEPVGGVGPADREERHNARLLRGFRHLSTRTENRGCRKGWSREVPWVPRELLDGFFGDTLYRLYRLPRGPGSAGDVCRQIEHFRALAVESCGGSLLVALEAWYRGERSKSADQPLWIE